MKRLCFGLLCLAGCFACTSRSESRLQDLIGKRIEFPFHSAWSNDSVLPADTVASITILSYYNAEGCTPCRLKELAMWRGPMSEQTQIRYLYVLNTQNIALKELKWTLEGMRIDHPVYLDTAGLFERSNPGLPTNPVFHTFLLDKENRVVLVGSPIGNPKMWELYKSTIARLAAHGGTLPDEQTKMPLGQ